MTRTLTILAAATAAALAVSAAPASAGSKKPPAPSPKSHTATHPRNLNDIEAIDHAVTDGTSNTIVFAERRANLTHVGGGSNGIIAVLIGL